MSGNRKYTAAHLNEHAYCSNSYNRSLETSRTTVGADNPSHSANFYLEQRAPVFAPSLENGHLGYYSASGSTSHSQARKRSRTVSEPRSASASKKSPSDSSAPESHRISQRLQNRTTPLSCSSCNLPSTSSASNSQQTKSRKSSDAKTSSGSKRSNFSKGQTAVLKGWLEAHLENPYPTETEKLVLAEKAKISLNQVNDYYTNARRRGYLKICAEKGIVPVQRKNKAKICTIKGEKENQPPVHGSGLASDAARRASRNSSNKSPQMETSSPEIEASPEQVLVVDEGTNRQVPVFKEGSGFIPAPPLPAEQSQEHVFDINAEASQEHVLVVDAGINPPVSNQGSGFIPASHLPADESPKVLAVSRQVTDHPVRKDVPRQRYSLDVFLSVVEMFRNAELKAERKMRRKHCVAERLMAETPGATAHQETGYIY